MASPSRSQYYVDALFALGTAVGLVCSDWVWQGRASVTKLPRHRKVDAGGRPNDFRFVVIACGAFVVLHLALLPAGISSINKGNGAQPIARAWIGNLQDSLAAIDARHPATVIPLTVPPSFDPSFEGPFNLESEMFPLLPAFAGTTPVRSK